MNELTITNAEFHELNLAAERSGNALGNELIHDLLILKGQSQAVALLALHNALYELSRLLPFDAAAGGFAVALVNVLEIGIAHLPKTEDDELEAGK